MDQDRPDAADRPGEPNPFSREGSATAAPYTAAAPTPYAGSGPYGYAPVQNQKAMLALVFGISGFVLVAAVIGGFIGIAGIVLGRKARREIDADPQRYTGRAMATAGFWLGLASVVGAVVFVALIIVVVLYAPDSAF